MGMERGVCGIWAEGWDGNFMVVGMALGGLGSW